MPGAVQFVCEIYQKVMRVALLPYERASEMNSVILLLQDTLGDIGAPNIVVSIERWKHHHHRSDCPNERSVLRIKRRPSSFFENKAGPHDFRQVEHKWAVGEPFGRIDIRVAQPQSRSNADAAADHW